MLHGIDLLQSEKGNCGTAELACIARANTDQEQKK